MRIVFTVAIACLVAGSVTRSEVSAATVNDNIGVSGGFDATLGGSGTATLNSASGTFKQWLLFFHANVGVSADAQTVGISIPTVTPSTMTATGTVNMDYDNLTPGTPQTINSANVNLNGGMNIGYNINVAPIEIDTSLGSFDLNLTVSGNITDIDFVSSGSAPVIGGNGGAFGVPGDFILTLDGTVNGSLSGVPIIGNVNLGTITSIAPTPLSFSALLPGIVTTSDLDGGVGPFPNDMLANFQAALAGGLSVPLSLPLNVNETASIGSGQSGFSSLQVDGQLDAVLTLSDVGYDVSGTVAQTLVAVPEPTSGLFLAALAAGGGAVVRRRRT